MAPVAADFCECDLVGFGDNIGELEEKSKVERADGLKQETVVTAVFRPNMSTRKKAAASEERSLTTPKITVVNSLVFCPPGTPRRPKILGAKLVIRKASEISVKKK